MLRRSIVPSADIRGELGLESFLARQASHSSKRKRKSAFACGSLSSPFRFPLITGKRRGVRGGGAGRQQEGQSTSDADPSQGSQNCQAPVGDMQLAGEALGDIPGGGAWSRPALPAPTCGFPQGPRAEGEYQPHVTPEAPPWSPCPRDRALLHLNADIQDTKVSFLHTQDSVRSIPEDPPGM